jgi:adenosylcobinamide-GDP ribazoletransferase
VSRRRRGEGAVRGADRLREEWLGFLLALQFLTRIPVRAPWTPQRMAASLRWHPAVGLIVGAASGAVLLVAAPLYGQPLAALLATAAAIVLTGALHEDGLADVCDGLGGGAERERALAIMRDSRIGAFGALGLGMALAAKILSLAALPASTAALALVCAHAASRASVVATVAASRYVRPVGAGAVTAARVTRAGLAVACLTAAAPLAALALLVGPAAAAAAAAGLALAHLAMRRLFERRLGGYTGDCLGAVQQTGEVAFYLGMLAWL